MPKSAALTVLAFLALVPLCACSANPPRLEASAAELRASIEAATDAMAAAARANDLQAVARAYADDAVLLGPDGLRMEGRAAIDAYWMKLAGNVVDWQLDTFEVHGARDVAHQTGRSRLYMRAANGAAQLSEVLFCVIWRRQPNGTWQIVVDAYWPPVAKT